jgi:hypothetical protein
LKKSINISFEIAFLIILMIGGGFYSISSKYGTSWLLALALVVYAVGIISITLRTSLKKQGDRRAVSTFFFGLACGICYGALLSLVLPEAANLNVLMIVSGILVWGIAGGLIAVFSAYIISLSFIKDLYRFFFSRDHEKQ